MTLPDATSRLSRAGSTAGWPETIANNQIKFPPLRSRVRGEGVPSLSNEAVSQTRPDTKANNDCKSNAKALGLETVSGSLIGRDPRAMSVAELNALGHNSNSVLGAVRRQCLECSGGPLEARKCVVVQCPLWPMRMGTNPLARRELTEGQREVRQGTRTGCTVQARDTRHLSVAAGLQNLDTKLAIAEGAGC